MDRIVVITGGTSGIGKALAEKFLADNDKVIILAIDANPENANEYICDVANEEQVKDFLYNLELPKPCFDVLSDKWDIKDIEPFGDLRRLWGNDLVEPQYYQKVIIKTKDISVIGASKTTIKFKIGNVTYIKFFCNHEWIEELMGKDYFELL